jgi:hypothetical protein
MGYQGRLWGWLYLSYFYYEYFFQNAAFLKKLFLFDEADSWNYLASNHTNYNYTNYTKTETKTN